MTDRADPGPSASGSPRRAGAALAGAAVLVVLHLAPGWSPALAPGPVLVLGAVPAELVYRLAWMALALAYLVAVTRAPADGEGRP